jgi:hypothetical protein
MQKPVEEIRNFTPAMLKKNSVISNKEKLQTD